MACLFARGIIRTFLRGAIAGGEQVNFGGAPTQKPYASVSSQSRKLAIS